MDKVKLFSLLLAAVLVGPVQAESCSGGVGGGTDATGNQCNTPDDVAVSSAESPSFWARYQALTGSPKVSSRSSTPTAPSAPDSAPVKIARAQNEREAPCLDDAYGGVRVTTNGSEGAPALERNNFVARCKAPNR